MRGDILLCASCVSCGKDSGAGDDDGSEEGDGGGWDSDEDNGTERAMSFLSIQFISCYGIAG